MNIRRFLVAGAIIGLGMAVSSQAATLSWSAFAPTVDGDDIANLGITTTSQVDNVSSGGANGGDTTYVSDNRPANVQTFQTGSNAEGYNLSAVTVQEVLYDTYRSLDTGWNAFNGRIVLRIGTIDGSNVFGSFLLDGNNGGTAPMVDPHPANGGPVAGTGQYATLTLDSTIHLDPNTTYAFGVWSTADQYGGPYFEMNGSLSNSFTDGQAYSETFDNCVAQTGDYVFHLDMVAGSAVLPVFLPILGTPTGAVYSNVLVQAEVVEGSGTFSDAVLYLDGTPVATNSTRSGTTNTVSYAPSELSLGTHWCKVVANSSSPVSSKTNEWKFTYFTQPASGKRVVSWNWNVQSTVNPGEYAGLMSVTNWHDSYFDGNYPGGPNGELAHDNLHDQLGTDSGIDITWSYTTQLDPWGGNLGGHPGLDIDGTANKEMINGFMDGFNGTNSIINLSQIPYDYYDIYVYFSGGVGRQGTVSDGSTTHYFNAYGPDSKNGSYAIFAQATDTTTNGYATAANFAVFSELSGANQTITVVCPDTDGGIGIAGIQVVEVDAVLSTVPNITGITPSGASVMLTWDSEAGATYKILRKIDLSGGSWTAIKTDIAGIAGTTTDSDPAPPVGSAFYRIEGNK